MLGSFHLSCKDFDPISKLPDAWRWIKCLSSSPSNFPIIQILPILKFMSLDSIAYYPFLLWLPHLLTAPKHQAVPFRTLSVLILAVFRIYTEAPVATSQHLWWSLWRCLSHHPPCQNLRFLTSWLLAPAWRRQLQAPHTVNTALSVSSSSTLVFPSRHLLGIIWLSSPLTLPFSPLSVTPSLLFLPSLGVKVHHCNLSLVLVPLFLILTWQILKLVKPIYLPAPHPHLTAKEMAWHKTQPQSASV